MGRKVAYFSGCAANYVDPAVGKATIRVLEKNGLYPLFPDQTCCGFPPLRCGDVAAAKKKAEFNVRRLAQVDCDIVTACTTCALALKKYYPYLLADREEAIEVSRRTYDVSEYLALLYEQKALDDRFSPLSLSLVYHAPCHLKVLGQELVERRLRLLHLIPQISLSWLERGCCGLAGTFGVKKKHYVRSMKIGQTLFEGIKQKSPQSVVTDCPACKWQVELGTGFPVTHPVLLLQQAYRLD